MSRKPRPAQGRLGVASCPWHWVPSVMCGRPRRSKGDLVCCAAVGCGHVSGLCCAALGTVGPDAIRSLVPKQIYALEWRITHDGFFQAPGSTGSPSRHHRPPHPSAVATADGVPSASGCATWDCCRHAISFSTHEQSPCDPRRFVSLCHRDEPCRPAFEQAFEPASLGCGFAS